MSTPPAKEQNAELDRLRSDMRAMAFNHHYDGWKYREPQEGYEAVAKDCKEAACRIVEQYEQAVSAAAEARARRELAEQIKALNEMQPELKGTWQNPNYGVTRRQDIRDAVLAALDTKQTESNDGN